MVFACVVNSELVWYAGRKLPGLSVIIEIDLGLVWVVEIDSVSVWGMELDVISASG